MLIAVQPADDNGVTYFRRLSRSVLFKMLGSIIVVGQNILKSRVSKCDLRT